MNFNYAKFHTPSFAYFIGKGERLFHVFIYRLKYLEGTMCQRITLCPLLAQPLKSICPRVVEVQCQSLRGKTDTQVKPVKLKARRIKMKSISISRFFK